MGAKISDMTCYFLHKRLTDFRFSVNFQHESASCPFTSAFLKPQRQRFFQRLRDLKNRLDNCL